MITSFRFGAGYRPAYAPILWTGGKALSRQNMKSLTSGPIFFQLSCPNRAFSLDISRTCEHIYRVMENNAAVKAPTTAKIIVLAGMWRRAFAFLIDILCVLALSALIYFPCVVPFAVDMDRYNANRDQINSLAIESGLYLDFNDSPTSPLSMTSFETVEDITHKLIVYGGERYSFSMIDVLHQYWTITVADMEFVDGKNHVYSDEAFEKTVMKVGDEDSNIERLRVTEDGYLTVDLIDEEKDWVAIEYVCDRYNEAVLSLNDTVLFTELDADNAKIMQFAMLMAVPVLTGSCLVFMVVLPMCLGEGQSLGKKSMKLVVLDDMGYTYNKWKLIPRNLFCFIVEFIGGIASFGALLLITYTMSMFTKKHRSIHDYLFGSVVADSESSLWFDNPVEEELYNAKKARETEAKEKHERLSNQANEQKKDSDNVKAK